MWHLGCGFVTSEDIYLINIPCDPEPQMKYKLEEEINIRHLYHWATLLQGLPEQIICLQPCNLVTSNMPCVLYKNSVAEVSSMLSNGKQKLKEFTQHLVSKPSSLFVITLCESEPKAPPKTQTYNELWQKVFVL